MILSKVKSKIKSKTNFLFAVLIVTSFAVPAAICQNRQAGNENKPQTKALLKIENFVKPPTFQIKPQELPAPFATESVRRNSKIAEQPANAILKLPKGFRVNVYAEGDFQYPRWMVLAPNGDAFVALHGSWNRQKLTGYKIIRVRFK